VKRKLVILVADDDPRDLELIHLALARDGILVDLHEVHDGEKVVQYLEGTDGFTDRAKYPFPDLLLIDLKMPKMDGLEVLEWLQKHPACKRLPRVMLSGSGLDKDVEEAYRRGANTYFAKPTSFKDFQGLIKVLIEYWSRSQRPRIGQC